MTPPDDLPDPKREEWNVDAMWSRVRARTVDAGAGEPRRAEPELVPERRSWPWRKLYAAALVLAVVGLSVQLLRPRHDAPSTTAARKPADYTTPRGQFATVHLTDSSEVTLAPESHLTIGANFGDGVRELSLEGEAIFTVRHSAAHPFRVRARGAIVEDIGTRFDVRAYPGDATVTVAVVEGSVSMRSARADSATTRSAPIPPLVLARGEVGTIDSQGKLSIERAASASTYVGWPAGRFSFVDRPLPEVLRAIGRWYDLDVRVDDPRLATRMVNAEFAGQSPTEMIDAIALAVDATVERAGHVITLKRR